MAKLNETTLALAQQIGEGTSIDSTTGVVTFSEGLYEKILPEGLTKEVIEQVRDFDTAVVAAGIVAVGEKANEAGKANPDINKIVASMPATGKDSFDFKWERQRTYAGINGNPDVTKYGVMAAGFDMHGIGRRGQVSVAMDHVGESAAKLFCD